MILSRPFLALFALGCFSAGCGSRTLVEGTEAPCLANPPQCVVPSDACSAPLSIEPTCDAKTSAWSCPSGSRVYARASGAGGSCLPFHEADGSVAELGGSLVRVPIDDGRCLWVSEQILTRAGSSVRNVGFEQDLSEPFGSCPMSANFFGGAPVPVVTIVGTTDPTLLVQVDGGYRIGGETRVLYRLFKTDPTAVFGVTELGSGLGAWDSSAQQIVVPDPDGLSWGTDLDLGDASRVVGGVPYVWGCHGPPHFLTNSCDLARLDEAGTAQLFTGSGWVADDELRQAKTVFDSGPWISSVVPSPSGGFAHVYAVGFGSTLETHTARSVTGPWTEGPTLASCDLPSRDSHAFCAGPVVHEEIDDPTRPGELVVSYGVGTTAPNQDALLAADPEAYWTRLVWVGSP
jgi:hypothetical protein